VLVHGDYDVDGVSGAALLTLWIRRLGGTAVPFVPHRIRDGYDLGPAGLRAAASAGATLLVTCDSGTVANEAIERAVAQGLDVIVTDHHTPGERLPPAFAIVNPTPELA
jgi:single-stranded-DNA-specific exonuclease